LRLRRAATAPGVARIQRGALTDREDARTRPTWYPEVPVAYPAVPAVCRVVPDVYPVVPDGYPVVLDVNPVVPGGYPAVLDVYRAAPGVYPVALDVYRAVQDAYPAVPAVFPLGRWQSCSPPVCEPRHGTLAHGADARYVHKIKAEAGVGAAPH